MFSAKELKMLIDIERQMDRGETPFIYVEGSRQRCAMREDVMRTLGLETGQTVTQAVWIGILELNIKML